MLQRGIITNDRSNFAMVSMTRTPCQLWSPKGKLGMSEKQGRAHVPSHSQLALPRLLNPSLYTRGRLSLFSKMHLVFLLEFFSFSMKCIHMANNATFIKGLTNQKTNNFANRPQTDDVSSSMQQPYIMLHHRGEFLKIS